jgi:hypothetical protein
LRKTSRCYRLCDLAHDDPSAEALPLTAAQRADLEAVVRSGKTPQRVAVFCVDEKTAIQALDRRDPILPLSPGRAERHGFEYVRHGTLSLYAALETQTGVVIGKTCTPQESNPRARCARTPS